jgi:hypothetical protein
MVLPATGNRLRLRYRPASPSFDGEMTIGVGELPDPTRAIAPTRDLGVLADGVTDELDAYSRWIGKHPGDTDSIHALAALPPELIDDARARPIDELVERLEDRLADAYAVVVDPAALLEPWSAAPSSSKASVPKAKLAAATQLLAKRGLGVEPDIRAGGAEAAKGQVAIFRLDAGDTGASTGTDPRWPITSAVTDLVALIGDAEKSLPRLAPGPLAEAIGRQLQLPATPMNRIAARLVHARAAGVTMRNLKRRLGPLDPAGRAVVASFLVGLATNRGPAGPSQVTALSTAYRMLGLESSELFSQVHQAELAPPAGARPGDTTAESARRAAGFAPVERAGPATPRSPAGIDFAAVRATAAETAEVGAFLGQIFVDDDPEPAPAPFLAPASVSPPTPAASALVVGLDRAHSDLLRRLGERAAWSRSELEAAARGLGLFPQAAIDTINEASLDARDDLVCEGDDPIDINLDLLKDLI